MSGLGVNVDGQGRDRHRRSRAASAPRPRHLLAEQGLRGRVRGPRHRAESPLPIPGTIDDTVHRIVDAGGDAIAVPTNLAKDDDVERMVATTIERYGRVDILVNNAAITFPGDLDLDAKRFDLVMQVDLRAPLLAIQAVVPGMQ